MGIAGVSLERAKKEVAGLIGEFGREAESFYDRDAIKKGYVILRDRAGKSRPFPLVSVSAVILEMPPGRARRHSPDSVGNLMAQEKKKAKTSPSKISVVRIDPPDGFSMENVNSCGVETATEKLSVTA